MSEPNSGTNMLMYKIEREQVPGPKNANKHKRHIDAWVSSEHARTPSREGKTKADQRHINVLTAVAVSVSTCKQELLPLQSVSNIRPYLSTPANA